MTMPEYRLLNRCRMGVAREGFRVGPGRPENLSPLVWRRSHLLAAGAAGASPPDWHQLSPPEQRARLAALSGLDVGEAYQYLFSGIESGSSHARQRQVHGVAAGAALMVSTPCLSRVCEVASATVSYRAARWVTPMVVGSCAAGLCGRSLLWMPGTFSDVSGLWITGTARGRSGASSRRSRGAPNNAPVGRWAATEPTDVVTSEASRARAVRGPEGAPATEG